MTTVSPQSPSPAAVKATPVLDYDPDAYRMSIGDHLDELRRRLFRGLIGFIIAVVVCLLFGRHIVRWFLHPLMAALASNHLSPQAYALEPAETFTVYIRVSCIVAFVIAGPWICYQVWQFVASGLYPHERRYVTRYLPLSIGLFLGGMAFLYYVALPLMLTFFLHFNVGIPFDFPTAPVDTASQTTPEFIVPTYRGDPPHPKDGSVWYDATQGRLKLEIGGEARVLMFASTELVTPSITLASYISMVIVLMLSFGIAFQMPLAVLALVRLGIIDRPTLKHYRRHVWLVEAILAGVIVPDVTLGMIALLIPLILLFEMGLWMAREPRKQRHVGM